MSWVLSEKATAWTRKSSVPQARLNSANTGKGAASAYQQVSVPNTNYKIPGYGNASMAGQLQIAAQGATVDIGDSVITNNLQTLGTVRANQTARQTDIANLEAATQTQDPSQQTIMAELQRINQALLLQLRLHKDLTDQIHAPLWLNVLGLVFAVSAVIADLFHLHPNLLILAALGAVVCFAISGVRVLQGIRRQHK